MSAPADDSPVRRQYENYPFPQRDPRTEAERLYVTGLDGLAKINHYCFSGRQSFDRGFRALVAGGGSGDAAIYLGEQLRGRDAEVVYVDLSDASMAIARQRAEVRKLDNVRWHRTSLLELDPALLGEFDYINCAGVLHHLPDPAAGLAALSRVLKDDGAMGLMVYGLAGRQDVYLAQQLMRVVNDGESDLGLQIDNARRVLASLPGTNWLLRGRSRAELLGRFENDVADIVDTFLHVQDQAFSVDRLYSFLDGAGLNLIAFTNFLVAGTVGTRLEYDPRLYISDAALLARISGLPLRAQQSAAELMSGAISLHTFYAARSGGRKASFSDAAQVPFFLTTTGRDCCGKLGAVPGEAVDVVLRPGVMLRFNPGSQTRELVRRIDDRRTLGDIAAETQAQSGDIRLEARTIDEMEVMSALDWIALRAPSVPPFPAPVPYAAFAP